jgi:tetratricopeptide (TPR) repeat protein
MLGLLLSLAGVARATPLDDSMAEFKKAQVQTEAAVATILKAGLQEYRTPEALNTVRAWLNSHPAASPAVQYYAGVSLEYMGDAAGAVTLYRKFLKNTPLEPRLAGLVVNSVYRLLLSDLRQPDAAYILMREDGDSLRAFGNARQYDAWYLAEARRRDDVQAACNRLVAIIASEPTNLVACLDDLEWACRKLETFVAGDPAWMESALKLVALPQVPESYRARVNWVKEIVPYTKEATALFRANKPIPDALLEKPLKAAEALAAALPYEGSILVARGWMNLREGHTPNFWKYLAPRRDAKTAPIIRAMASLPPQKARAILSAPGCPQGRPVYQLFYAENNYATAEMKTLIRSLPAAFNSLAAPPMDMFGVTMTVEEAKALSPLLARNPSPHAALIRAYAMAGANTVSAMVPVMMKSELWRFDSLKKAVDTVWNSGAKRDGDQDALYKQYKDFGARTSQLKKQIAKEASSQDRMAAFKAIYQELQGTSYETPGLLALWDDLLGQAPSADQEKILQKLVSDFIAASPAALESQQYFLVQALAKISFGNPYSRLTFGPEFAGGWDQWGYGNVRKALPGLASDLGKLLRQQMVAGALSEPVFGMWLHCVDPGTPETKALFQELVKTAAYEKMNPAYHAMATHPLLFGRAAMTPAMLAKEPVQVSRELMELPADAAPEQVERAFMAVVVRAEQAAARVAISGMRPVAELATWRPEIRVRILSLFKDLAPIGDYPALQGYEQVVIRFVRELQEAKQWGQIMPYLGGFWRVCQDREDESSRGVADALAGFAEAALAADKSGVALGVARTGLRNATLSKTAGPVIQARRSRLGGIESKAAMALGETTVAAKEGDPSFPLYKSASEFAQGNLDTAWSLYIANSQLVQEKVDGGQISLIQKLTPEYGFWLLKRGIAEGLTAEAEVLVKELTLWSRQQEGRFSPQQEAELKIAYADLVFLKGALPTARAWYGKVVDAREYHNTEVYLQAALGIVKVDRVSKNFGSALELLDKLMEMKEPAARLRVHYARSEVFMDQENYKDALEETAVVLRSNPNHADALILRGKIQFQMRKLVEASEIELGVSRANKVMVPGELVKINLIDPSLNVSGVGVDIEVEVWAKSGDREVLMLHQLGDSKDKYRAEVPTALGTPVPGDKVLQVLGVDEIRYGYSKAFRAKMKDLPRDPDTIIGIASDAGLLMSAGAFSEQTGQSQLDIESLGTSASERKLGVRYVRPGNPIYLRVTDPDQSKTAGNDTVTVSVNSSSGDEMRSVVLTETGPYTGVFEGSIQTAGGQAMAYASESAPGRDPNMAISSQVYPGWMGNVGDKEKMRIFGVDVHDNAMLDTMMIKFPDDKSRLTHGVLQTSMEGQRWVTRARFPGNPAPWTGQPRVTSFPTYRGGFPVTEPKGPDLPVDWLEKMELASASSSCGYLAATVRNISAGPLPMVETGHPNYSGLIQFRALFYQPELAVRRFKLSGYPEQSTIFLIDGQSAGKGADDPLLIERELKPGLHEIQVWRHESRSALLDRKPVLSCDVPDKDDLVPCSDSMFDPVKFPEGVRAQIAQPAVIEKTEDGLKVSFGAGTQARLVRLAILGYEGVAPAIKAVTLTDRAGRKLLPVKEDYMALRQNSQLEVLPGDQLVARYMDPVSATPKRNRHEKSLQAAFNTATIQAAFLNYKNTAQGRVLELEPIRRFKFEDALSLVVDDADLDASPERDTLTCRVVSSAGAVITVKALETEPHSGQFLARVFPVAGKPQRDSEIQVAPGGILTATYRDEENLDPGIPADRTVILEHARYMVPQLDLYTQSSTAVQPAAAGNEAAKKKTTPSAVTEAVTERRVLNYEHVADARVAGTALSTVIGADLRFDVVAPHLALGNSSTISAYAQVVTQSVSEAGQVFDVTLPGTMKLTVKPGRLDPAVPSGYRLSRSAVPPSRKMPLDEGRFSFGIPLVLGDRLARSYATADAEALPASALPPGLVVQAGDRVRVGFAWQDEQGQVKWKTAELTVGAHAFLDVMDEGYKKDLTEAFVGERIFVRVVASGMDRGPQRDTVSVSLKANSGAATALQLMETDRHSGVFKAGFPLGYADAEIPAQLPPVELNGFPVRYGDKVEVGYAASGKDPAQTLTVSVNTGADGNIEPFTKRFTGDEMSVKTSFTLAECFFELAKKHSKMNEESLARREIAHSQKLLSEAVATHRDNSLKAQAEYLLGNLAQEYADLAKNEESKLPMYQDALARFSKIPVDYPESEFAPKAQFKTALVYEKMGEADLAVEEYVKLAYKYPSCEFIPESMSRIGGYFQARGQALKDKADPLREKKDVESQGEVLRLDEQASKEFLEAAIIFGKLYQRYPEHELAGLAGLRSAQNYMRANQNEKAIEVFTPLMENQALDGVEIRAQAIYWSGLSHERWLGATPVDNYKLRGKIQKNAYDLYKRVTYDFPDSKWAKFARGRLADPAFAKLVEQEQQANQRMLDMLNEQKKKKR